MINTDWLLLVLSVTEILLLLLVVVFFLRLRQSEAVLSKLRSKQEELLNKLRFNAQLEQEIVASFEQRQNELTKLDQLLEARAADMKRLLKQAEEVCKSPQFLREIVVTGCKRGKSSQELARATGLSLEEVELIIEQAGL
ncbi:MAG: hypothetical protein ACNI3A_02030 [Desulfovibrio sp.]|uniref:hypothetical protein n=1 Tax=Desulfovibrio sp. 7SRBS1 TaxID=3378064 RepID=UPI003B418B45